MIGPLLCVIITNYQMLNDKILMIYYSMCLRNHGFIFELNPFIYKYIYKVNY